MRLISHSTPVVAADATAPLPVGTPDGVPKPHRVESLEASCCTESLTVEARPEYRLWVRFADGIAGEVDLSHIVGCGVFQRWVDHPAEFHQGRIDPETGAPVWPRDLNVAPEGLYKALTTGSDSVRMSKVEHR